MKMDKDSIEETEVECNLSDSYDVLSIKSTSPLPNRISSSSPSSSDGERSEIDDSDNDSGFAGDSLKNLDFLDTVIPKVKNETNSNRAAELGKVETYDREAILYELACPENLGVTQKIERLQMKTGTTVNKVFTESFLYSKNIDSDTDKTAEERRQLMAKRLRETLQAVPDTLLHILTGRTRPGDCGRSLDKKPEWLDMDKLRRGQKFIQDHTFATFFSEVLSFPAIFSFEDSLKPLIITQKSSTPYTAFRRYLSTALRVRRWHNQDPWAKGTAAQKDILIVRAKHAAARQKLVSITNDKIDAAATISNAWCPTQEMLLEDFSETCNIPMNGQCPYVAEKNSIDRPKGINQAEMALTQWGFVGLITSFPERCGVHCATDEDLEAFCHLWRSIGYQLGIEDEFNFCRGTLEEIRQRSHDFVETWVKPQLRVITPEWEHMLRCLYAGNSIILPGLTYETALLHLTEILDLKMPRLYASLSCKDWISYNLTKSFIHFTIKLPGMSSLINGLVNRALDRAEKFTPEEFEAIRIKLSNYPENNVETNVDRSIVTSSIL